MASPYDGLTQDALNSLLTNPYTDVQDDIGGPEVLEPRPALTMQESFERGLDAGVAGMQSSVAAFRALTGTLIGTDEDVADAIQDSSYYNQEAADALAGMQEFSDFVDAPTFDGFLMQASSALGQAAPSIATTVGGALATGGTSVLAQAAGKGVMVGVNKYAARRVIKDAVENVANDVASPDEKALVDSLYTTFKRGALVGAGGASFVPQAGANFSEGLEAGRDPDASLALRSLAVAAPQAALDVGAQALILRNFVKVAKAKPSTDGSILGELAKTIGASTAKGAVTEGITEATQEGISVLNRMDMDSTYSTQEAQMRIAQGAFMGLVAGGVMGAGSGTLGGGVQAGRRVFDRAQEYLQQGQEQQADAAMNSETYGDYDGYTSPESNADITAQLSAMFSTEYGKSATWVAGDIDPATRASIPEDNKVYKVDIGGKRAFAAHIPGRGTIYGRQETVQAIVAEGASDQSLQIALGYSGVKQGDEDLVVQVQDANGNVVWEEATTADRKAAALLAADGIAKDAGTIRTLSLKDALAERKAKYDAERGPSVTPVQEDPVVQEETPAPSRPVETPAPSRPARKPAQEALFTPEEAPTPSQPVETPTPSQPESSPTSEENANYQAYRSVQAQYRYEVPDELADEALSWMQSRNGRRFSRYQLKMEVGLPVMDERQLAFFLYDLEAAGLGERIVDNTGFWFRYTAGLPNTEQQAAPEIPQELQAPYDWVSSQDGEFSISGLQRALRQGFNKTKRQIQQLTEKGLIRQNEKGRYEFIGPRIRKLDEEFADEVVAEDGEVEIDDTGANLSVGDQTAVDATQGEFDAEIIETQQFEPRNKSKDDEGGFKNTAEVRQAFTEAFQDEMDVDFNLPFYNNMSESFMKRAVEFKNQNPTEFVSITVNPDLTYRLDLLSTPETETVRILEYRTRKNEEVDVAGEKVDMPAIERSVPVSKFLRDTIAQARRSRFADQGAVLITPDGQSIPVNMADLTNAGKRLAEARDRGKFQEGGPTQAALRGLTAILSELASREYDLQINGVSALKNQNTLRRSNIVVDTTGGQQITARELFVSGKIPTRPEPRRRETDTRPSFRNEEGFYSAFEVRNAQGQTLETLDSFEEAKKARDRIRSELPQSQQDLALEIVPIENPNFVELDDQIVNKSSVETEYEVFRSDSVPDDTTPSGNRVTERSIGRFATEQDAKDFINYMQTGPRQLGLFGQKQFGFEAEPSFEIRRTDRVVESNESLLETPERMGLQVEEDPGDGIPLSRLNLEDNPRYQSRRRGAGKIKRQPSKLFREATYPFGLSGTLAKSVINRAITKLRLGKPVSVIGLAGLKGKSVREIRAMFGDESVANAIIRQLGELRDNPNAQGRYIGFRDAHIILIDDRNGNELQHALAATHELGHALFEEERTATLQNKALRTRLQQSFEKAKAAEDAPQAYQGELGFEEWYADQVAVWAQRLYKNQKRNAKNMTEGHFKQLAEKLRRMWQAISVELRRRFSNYDPNFDSYIDAVVNSARRNREAAYRRSAARETTFEQLAIVRQLDEAQASRNPRELAQRMIKKIRTAIDSQGARSLTRNILAADNILSSISKPIARMFYGKSQDGAELGFVPQTTVTLNKWVSRLQDAIGTEWDGLGDAFAEAASDTATSDLKGPALAIRKYLEQLYDELIAPANVDIKRQENYFPVALDLAKIYEDVDGFVAQLMIADPKLDAKAARKTIQGIINRQQYILDDRPIDLGNDPNPSKQIEMRRRLTRLLSKEQLKDYTLPPDQALTQYIRHAVKRVEFAKATRDEKGKDRLGPLLDNLNVEDRRQAIEIINTYLGYNSKPLNPTFRKVSSWAQFIQMATLLPLATLSSFPELAGAVVNTKEFGGVTMAMKEMVRTIGSRQQSMELARNIGVAASSTMQNLFMSEAEAEFLDPTVRNLSDKFFYYTGLDFFTRFTREFSANMGVSFILTHAHNKSGNPRAARYLEDLGLTADEVKAWERGGRKFDNETGRKVERGLQRFVEASALRPNAAERPIWASDPHMAVVWQLKGYFYSFGKVILGGLRREASKRINEADGNALAAMSGIGTMLLLTGIAYLPLAMLSLELREYAKYGIAWVLPGVDADAKRYFKSDQMDWPAYLNESFDRSGLMGPLALLTMAGQQADWGQSGVASLLGPTAEMFEDIASDGWEVVPNRLLPLYTIVY